MFSGIIAHLGTVSQVTPQGDGLVLAVKESKIAGAATLGDSIAVNGVCLTVSRIEGDTVMFDVMEKTVSASTIGNLNVGDKVNMEPSLRMGDQLGGHYVYGHVDDRGEVTNITPGDDATLMQIALPDELMRYMVPKGSVAIDGVSLTIASIEGNAITVSLVPHTLLHTTFQFFTLQQQINIEVDMLAKYAAAAVSHIAT